MDAREAGVVGRMAIGRLLRLMSRPYQPGDELEYGAARVALMEASEVLGIDASAAYEPDYPRDRRRGAAGD
jgi:hypothetical protein